MVKRSPSTKMSKVGSYNVAVFSNTFSEVTSRNHHVELSHPPDWLDALRTDDVGKATAILQEASAKYKEFLMNSDIPTFNSNQRNPSQRHQTHKCSSVEFSIAKPLHAAAIFHSHGVLRLLFTSGVDIQQVDSWKNYAVHVLILAASMGSVCEMKYVETLACLQYFLSEQDLISLLTAENEFSLRPLEFAALHGCTELANAIMHTKGVYLIKEESVGYNVVQYFDVSDYELFDKGLPPRFFNSPLALLPMSYTPCLKVPECDVVLHDPGFKSWVHSKIKMNWPFAFIWFLFRICYIALFFSASTENSWPTVVINGSYPNTNNTEEIVICSPKASYLGSYKWGTLALVSLAILIYDVCNHFRMRTMHHPALLRMLKNHDFVISVQFYRGIQFATCFSLIAICVCQVLRTNGFAVPPVFDYILFLAVSCGCAWGVLYFLQVLPWIGIYAFAVQKMLFVFNRFMVIFLLFLSAFALSFRRILLNKSLECPKHFDTIVETMYSSFLVIVNLVNFRMYENAHTGSLYLLHALFVFFISILLINFLIAAMMQSFSHIFADRCAIIQTQRLALMMTIQYRLAWPMQGLYKILQRKAFVFHN